MATDDKTTKPLTEHVTIVNGFQIVAIPGGLRITAPSGKRFDLGPSGMLLGDGNRELEVRVK